MYDILLNQLKKTQEIKYTETYSTYFQAEFFGLKFSIKISRELLEEIRHSKYNSEFYYIKFQEIILSQAKEYFKSLEGRRCLRKYKLQKIL